MTPFGLELIAAFRRMDGEHRAFLAELSVRYATVLGDAAAYRVDTPG